MTPPDLTITLTHDEVCFLLTTLGTVGMSHTPVPAEIRMLAVRVTQKIAAASGDTDLQKLPVLMEIAALASMEIERRAATAPGPRPTTDPSLN